MDDKNLTKLFKKETLETRRKKAKHKKGEKILKEKINQRNNSLK